MCLLYSITYNAINKYQEYVSDAHWQFLIIPEENETQLEVTTQFSNSVHALNEYSKNGYGFNTIRVQPKESFKHISFKASFLLKKKRVNPFANINEMSYDEVLNRLRDINFQVDFEPFLTSTSLTYLPKENKNLFAFQPENSMFINLQNLMKWVYEQLKYTSNVTSVDTPLSEIINHKRGVCQDFSHLFCALARQNGIPSRYVSGYLHQGHGYFGDSQMHAWAESFVPGLGWIGFDVTNNILAQEDHIKVAHGKDYRDCSPLKGVIYAGGKNETKHSVQVIAQQQQ
jgi:hypothetical protein